MPWTRKAEARRKDGRIESPEARNRLLEGVIGSLGGEGRSRGGGSGIGAWKNALAFWEVQVMIGRSGPKSFLIAQSATQAIPMGGGSFQWVRWYQGG